MKNLKTILLEQIKNEAELVQAWKEHEDLERAHKHQKYLIALLEVAEIALCGSRGGFDKGQFKERGSSITERIAWIMKNKHRIK